MNKMITTTPQKIPVYTLFGKCARVSEELIRSSPVMSEHAVLIRRGFLMDITD